MSNKELIKLIYSQLFSNDENIKYNIFEEYIGKNTKNDMIKTIISNNEIVLNNKSFQEQNSIVLDKLIKVKYINCFFNLDFNVSFKKTYYFEDCVFNEKLEIDTTKTFDDNALFCKCYINQVSIKNTTIEVKLFDFCTIRSQCSF